MSMRVHYIPRPEIPGNFFSSSFEQGVLDMVGLLLKLLVYFCEDPWTVPNVFFSEMK